MILMNTTTCCFQRAPDFKTLRLLTYFPGIWVGRSLTDATTARGGRLHREHRRADFDRLHSRGFQHEAIACAFDLLRLDGDDLRRLPLSERKAKLRKLLPRSADGMQYVEYADGDGDEIYELPASSDWSAFEAADRTLQVRAVRELD